MRILLVVDGSSYSDMATKTLKALQLPSQTEVTVMTVVPEPTFLGGITLDMLGGADISKKETQQKRAAELLRGPVQVITASGLKVESLVRWGNPVEMILKLADKTGASLVVMGAKGLTDPVAFRLGSVAQKVMKYAGCSVLLARKKTDKVDRGPLAKKTMAIDQVLLATDGSKYSDAATRFLLDLPLSRQSKVFVVTALQSHAAALMKMPTLDLETNQQLLAELQAAEEREARKITTRSQEQLQGKGYKTASMVMRGGAGECILKAAKENDTDIIALGSRGLTGIESFLLGGVCERVARYAQCSVLIVRPPRVKRSIHMKKV